MYPDLVHVYKWQIKLSRIYSIWFYGIGMYMKNDLLHFSDKKSDNYYALLSIYLLKTIFTVTCVQQNQI